MTYVPAPRLPFYFRRDERKEEALDNTQAIIGCFEAAAKEGLPLCS